MAKENKSPVKTISIMMIITLLGKISGLLRDRLLTINYGTGMEANAFLTASRIPRVFFDAVFASAITASFIPVFNEYMMRNGKKEAYKFSGNFITVISRLFPYTDCFGYNLLRPALQAFLQGDLTARLRLCVRFLQR